VSYDGIMAKKPTTLAPSAIALEAYLQECSDEERAALVGQVHRTMLWRYTTGRGEPDLERAFLIEDLTGGRVTARGWVLSSSAASEAA